MSENVSLPAGASGDDADLVRAFCAGDRGALGTLFVRYHARLVQSLRKRTDDVDHAEDAAMDAWMLALVRGDRFDPARSPFWVWLSHLGRNCLISRWRHDRRQRATGQGSPQELEQRLAELAGTPADTASVTETLGRLDPDDRWLLEKKYRDNWSLEEIGEALDVPPGTVGSRLFRARERFERAYQGRSR